MGWFRKHKKTDYSADDCRKKCSRLLKEMSVEIDCEKLESLAQQWAEFRELLARHENQNKSEIR